MNRSAREEMAAGKRESIFRVARRYPRLFTAVYAPAVIAVVVAGAIYRPFLGQLLVLVWCFFVGSFLIKGIMGGQLTDNTGTANRRMNPVCFWAKVIVWTSGYIFAMFFVIGMAVQERNKEKTESEVGPPSSERVLSDKPASNR